jgi:hypothetical protein
MVDNVKKMAKHPNKHPNLIIPNPKIQPLPQKNPPQCIQLKLEHPPHKQLHLIFYHTSSTII